MDTPPISSSFPASSSELIISGNLEARRQETPFIDTLDEIPFDPAEGKCSTRKTLEKELEEIEATLFGKLETTVSSAASDNEFMNEEGENWAEPWMSGSGENSTLHSSVWMAAQRNDTIIEERSRDDMEEEVNKDNVKEEVEELEMKKENDEEEKRMENKLKGEDVAEEDLAEVMDGEDRRVKEKQRERWMREQRRNTKDVTPR